MREWLDREVGPLLDALDPGLESGFGEDFGRTGDLTVFTPIRCKPTSPAAFRSRWSCAIARLTSSAGGLYIGDRLPRFRACKLDACGNGQYLAECVQRWAPRGWMLRR